MAETTSATTDGTHQQAGSPRRSTRLVWAIAAAALVAVGGTAYALVGSDDADQSTPSSEDVAGSPISPGGAITPGGASGSCVELYDLQTLANRDIVFDGTVQVVNGDQVTFAVNEWFRGDQIPEVSLSGAEGLGGLTSAGPTIGLEPGTRLLVAGDGGFAWSCGFTQPYDEAVAEQWRAALSG
ncbi:MAG: hypothetical protein H0W25_18160 [Acidimicrobiia bacterium]|nr:hypothetical protein [Acidimicrobiia bacterium]